jgi:hypothetical protein
VPSEKTPPEPEITAEEARAALLKCPDIRVIRSGEDDPIFVDLKSGAIVQTNSTNVRIGKFVTCNLKNKLWKFGVSNPSMHFSAHVDGRFELQPDGTWRAILTSKVISYAVKVPRDLFSNTSPNQPRWHTRLPSGHRTRALPGRREQWGRNELPNSLRSAPFWST